MVAPIKIQNGSGPEIYHQRIGSDGNSFVSLIEPTAKDMTAKEMTRIKQYVTYLANNGSEDMGVDGSVEPVSFRASAITNTSITLMGARFIFHDTQMAISGGESRRFGSGYSGGLPNGIEFNVVQSDATTNIFLKPITVIGEFYTYMDDFLNDVSGVTPTIDYLHFDFIFPVPIILPPDSNDYLEVVINDDLRSPPKDPGFLFNVVLRGSAEFLDV